MARQQQEATKKILPSLFSFDETFWDTDGFEDPVQELWKQLQEIQTSALSYSSCESNLCINNYCLETEPSTQVEEVEQSLNELEKIGKLKANWDGDGALAVSSISYKKAETFLRLVHYVGSSSGCWKKPEAVAADVDGRIYLSWWNQVNHEDREASVYIAPDSIVCIRSWGNKNQDKIDAVPLVLREDPIREFLSQWLFGK